MDAFKKKKIVEGRPFLSLTATSNLILERTNSSEINLDEILKEFYFIDGRTVKICEPKGANLLEHDVAFVNQSYYKRHAHFDKCLVFTMILVQHKE